MKPWSLLLLALLAACGSRPPQQVFVLGGVTEPAPGIRDDTGRTVIEIRPVLVPDHLDTTDILVRDGTNQINASSTGVWGERLSVGITQALAGALAKRVPSAVVVAHPPVNRPALQVLADISTLEVRPGADCVLTAHWTIVRFSSDGMTRQTAGSAQGSFVAPLEGTGDQAAVSAITAVLDQLADQIAAGLEAAAAPGRQSYIPSARR